MVLEAFEEFQYSRKYDREAMKKFLQEYRKIFLNSKEKIDNLFNDHPSNKKNINIFNFK